MYFHNQGATEETGPGASLTRVESGVLLSSGLLAVQGISKGVGSMVCVGRWKGNCQMATRIPSLSEGKKNITQGHQRAANFGSGKGNWAQAKSVRSRGGEELWDDRNSFLTVLQAEKAKVRMLVG